MAPLHRISIHGCPEHVTTSPCRVDWPVMLSEEPLIVCARVGSVTPSPKADAAIRRRIRLICDPLAGCARTGRTALFCLLVTHCWSNRGPAQTSATGSACHVFNNRNLAMRRASPASATNMAVIAVNQIPRAAAKPVGILIARSGADADTGNDITISEPQRTGRSNWHRG